MSLLAKVGSFAGATATGDQVIAGVGFTPKAIIVIAAGQTALGDTFDDTGDGGAFAGTYRLGAAFATAGEEKGVAVSSLGNVTTSDAGRRIANNFPLTCYETGGALRAGVLKTMNADGFTITWSTVHATLAHQFLYLALGGTDLLDAKLIDWVRAAAAGQQPVTGVGFEPDLVLHAHIQNNVAMGTGSAGAYFGLGAMDDAGGQWSLLTEAKDALGTSDTNASQDPTACLLDYTGDRSEFVSMNADGFTIDNEASTASRVISLCLRGGPFKVGSYAKPTGAAPAAHSLSVGTMRPRAALLTGVHKLAGAAGAGLRFGLGFSDGSSDGSAVVTDADNAAVTWCANNMNATKLFRKVNNDAATIDADAASLGLAPLGATDTWTPNDAVATEMFYIAMGEIAPLDAGTSTGAVVTAGVEAPVERQSSPASALHAGLESWADRATEVAAAVHAALEARAERDTIAAAAEHGAVGTLAEAATSTGGVVIAGAEALAELESDAAATLHAALEALDTRATEVVVVTQDGLEFLAEIQVSSAIVGLIGAEAPAEGGTAAGLTGHAGDAALAELALTLAAAAQGGVESLAERGDLAASVTHLALEALAEGGDLAAIAVITGLIPPVVLVGTNVAAAVHGALEALEARDTIIGSSAHAGLEAPVARDTTLAAAVHRAYESAGEAGVTVGAVSHVGGFALAQVGATSAAALQAGLAALAETGLVLAVVFSPEAQPEPGTGRAYAAVTILGMPEAYDARTAHTARTTGASAGAATRDAGLTDAEASEAAHTARGA